jgi:hypothetical protein
MNIIKEYILTIPEGMPFTLKHLYEFNDSLAQPMLRNTIRQTIRTMVKNGELNHDINSRSVYYRISKVELLSENARISNNSLNSKSVFKDGQVHEEVSSKSNEREAPDELQNFKLTRPEFISIEALLKGYKTEGEYKEAYEQLAKKQRRSKNYKPGLYGISRTDASRVHEIIEQVFAIQDDTIVQNRKINISRDFFNYSWDQFYIKLLPLLLNRQSPELDRKFIFELFIRVFASKMVRAIRKNQISILEILQKDKQSRDEAVSEFYEYTAPSNANEIFTAEFRLLPKTKDITDFYVMEHMLSTAKQKVKDNMTHLWTNDDYLVFICFSTLRMFDKNKRHKFLYDKLLTSTMYQNFGITHFRACTVSDFHSYLVKRGVFESEQELFYFDSSIGWLDRLLGALFCNQGKTFKGYTGYDPNPAVIEAARKLFQDLGYLNPGFHAKFNEKGIEKEDPKQIIKENQGRYFDMALTSPPYFIGKELYGINYKEKQAWFLYPTEEEFTKKFLVPLMQINYEVLGAGGIFALNYSGEAQIINALKIINSSYAQIGECMKLWDKGDYYPRPPVSVTSNGTRIASEKIYIFQRGNKIENPERQFRGYIHRPVTVQSKCINGIPREEKEREILPSELSNLNPYSNLVPFCPYLMQETTGVNFSNTNLLKNVSKGLDSQNALHAYANQGTLKNLSGLTFEQPNVTSAHYGKRTRQAKEVDISIFTTIPTYLNRNTNGKIRGTLKDLIDGLPENTCFSIQQLLFINNQFEVSYTKEAVKKFLSRMAQNGLINRVKRGVYEIIPKLQIALKTSIGLVSTQPKDLSDQTCSMTPLHFEPLIFHEILRTGASKPLSHFGQVQPFSDQEAAEALVSLESAEKTEGFSSIVPLSLFCNKEKGTLGINPDLEIKSTFEESEETDSSSTDYYSDEDNLPAYDFRKHVRFK